MELQEGAFRSTLVTIGRKTGVEHTVELRAVYHNGKFYFSRRNPNSDWLKNAISNPKVKVQYNDHILEGTASLVTDEQICKKISNLKYSDHRSEDARIVLEVTLNE
ncbi:MAG: nitroreductase/quinone reductase family protein [Nitrososphaera sp.]|jgi:hypothetical protein